MQNTSHNNFEQLVESYFLYSFTEDQKNAMDVFMRFFNSENQFCLYILQGFAGTGKSSLVAAIVKSLQEIKIKTRLLAPTGRAAKVLSSKSGKQVLTIHKKIYRKRVMAGGRLQLELAPNLHKNMVFIVDEASMIGEYSMSSDGGIQSRNLLEDVFEYVFSGEGCRLVFIGDEGQLPPVGSDYSPALDKRFLTQTFFGVKLFETRLTEVVRQSLDSDILLNAFNKEKS